MMRVDSKKVYVNITHNLSLIKHLTINETFDEKVHREVFVNAARHGQIQTMEYLYKYIGSTDSRYEKLVRLAGIECGSIETVKYIDEQYPLSHIKLRQITTYYEHASINGRLNIIKWLYHTYGHPERTSPVAHLYAGTYGHLDTLEWLMDHNFPTHPNTIYRACENGHFHILDHFLQSGGSYDNFIFKHIALGGHLNKLNELYESGIDVMTIETMSGAALSGNIEILEWLVQNGCPYNSNVCFSAAISENPSCLKYLRTLDCPWNGLTMRGLCSNPWSENLLANTSNLIGDSSTGAGKTDLVIWALESGCPYSLNNCVFFACQLGNLGILQLLVEQLDHTTSPPTWLDSPREDLTGFNYDCIDCDDNVLEWLKIKGSPCCGGEHH